MDVVLDTIGGETQQRSYGVLRVLATSAPPDEALAKAHNVSATFIFRSSDGNRLKKVVADIEANAIKVLIDGKTTPSSFDGAFEHQASGRARGKIILAMA